MRKLIEEGEYIPWGWGVSHWDFDTGGKWAYPIPLHFLVRWQRDFRCWLMTVGRPGYREKIERNAYNLGLEDGRAASAVMKKLRRATPLG